MGVLDRFAATVGDSGPVTCVGGRTHWHVGGAVDPSARAVAAPAGVVAHEPGEMIVRVRAGTPLAELQGAVAVGGQMVPVEADDPSRATIGGVLACGFGGPCRLAWGPPRDCVLEVTAVTAEGRLIRAGAPLVKNVTGFDLCRLFVGSLGTLAFLAEVVLRCRPLPEATVWMGCASADPFTTFHSLYRPLGVLWDGESTWVGLAGYTADVEAQAGALSRAGFRPVTGPPPLPGPVRRSLPPATLPGLPGRSLPAPWLAQVGVGVVHLGSDPGAALPFPPAAPGVVALNRRVKERFDPSGRLNPGRSPLGATA